MWRDLFPALVNHVFTSLQAMLPKMQKKLKSQSIIESRKFIRYKKSVKLPQFIVFNMGVLEDHRYHSLHMITKSVTSLSTNRTNSLEKTNKNVLQIILSKYLSKRGEKLFEPSNHNSHSNRSCICRFWNNFWKSIVSPNPNTRPLFNRRTSIISFLKDLKQWKINFILTWMSVRVFCVLWWTCWTACSVVLRSIIDFLSWM